MGSIWCCWGVAGIIWSFIGGIYVIFEIAALDFLYQCAIGIATIILSFNVSL